MKKKQQSSISAKYRKRTQAGEIWYRLSRNKGAMAGLIVVGIMVFIAVFADVLLDFDTQVAGYNLKAVLKKPSWEHLFGTDDMGRDMFNRVIYGTRYSMAIGASAVLFSLIFGVPIGAATGYFGGKFDLFVNRIMDVLSSIPSLLMGIVIVAALGQSIPNLIIAIGISHIPSVASITRASVLTVANQEYVESARNIGLHEGRIIVTHILPNCLSPIIVRVTLGVASCIISASSLSFLGLGVPVPFPEWGALLSAGRSYIRNYSYLTLFPGIAIMVTVLALNLLGDGLRDALDPKLRK